VAKRPEPTVTPEPEASSAPGKGHATPSRAEREAARKRPLVPSDRKEAAKNARAQNTEARERARAGMAAGDERYLTVRDKGAQRRFVRDYVDARWTVAEFLMGLMIFVLVLMFLPAVQNYGIFVLWGFVALAAIDAFVMCFTMRRRLAAKFGTIERGLNVYAVMRAMQFRFMRLPKPQVKRGAFPS
jgi:hypothetical protein